MHTHTSARGHGNASTALDISPALSVFLSSLLFLLRVSSLIHASSHPSASLDTSTTVVVYDGVPRCGESRSGVGSLAHRWEGKTRTLTAHGHEHTHTHTRARVCSCEVGLVRHRRRRRGQTSEVTKTTCVTSQHPGRSGGGA